MRIVAGRWKGNVQARYGMGFGRPLMPLEVRLPREDLLAAIHLARPRASVGLLLRIVRSRGGGFLFGLLLLIGLRGARWTCEHGRRERVWRPHRFEAEAVVAWLRWLTHIQPDRTLLTVCFPCALTIPDEYPTRMIILGALEAARGSVERGRAGGGCLWLGGGWRWLTSDELAELSKVNGRL